MAHAELVFEFLKVGLFSIGGGLATLPFLYRIADSHPWFTREMLVDMIAVSESTPGPIGLNMATYAGFAAGGVLGGVLASLALVVPSFFIVSFIVKVLDKFRENRFVKAAFYGIRPAVAALIASAALGILKITLIDLPAFHVTESIADLFKYKQVFLFLVIVYLTNRYNKHPVFYIAGAALTGVLFSF
ncbi:MAG: chromate transporter [Synergistaceae bacterium]|jgi:chromate transporter|nr:chromate transporter [Synergistaceae bacterium]